MQPRGGRGGHLLERCFLAPTPTLLDVSCEVANGSSAVSQPCFRAAVRASQPSALWGLPTVHGGGHHPGRQFTAQTSLSAVYRVMMCS